jgi:hypothetical protein
MVLIIIDLIWFDYCIGMTVTNLQFQYVAKTRVFLVSGLSFWREFYEYKIRFGVFDDDRSRIWGL